MANNINPYPVYRVKFEGLTGEMESIASIFWFSDFLGKSFGWRLAGNRCGIYQLLFWYLASKLLGDSRDWFIQSQKESSSFTPPTHE